MPTAYKELPERIKPFAFLGFSENGIRGKEYYGDCPLCGKRNKFHVNAETGKFSCKSGDCFAEGNVYSFLKLWYDQRRAEDTSKRKTPFRQSQWKLLEDDRECLSAESLVQAGIVFDEEGQRFVIPNFNAEGALIYLRFYKIGTGRVISLPKGEALEPGLFGMEQLADESRVKEPIYVCEGEWDAIALRQLLKITEARGIVVAVPGATLSCLLAC